jgi:hypothetical protein
MACSKLSLQVAPFRKREELRATTERTPFRNREELRATTESPTSPDWGFLCVKANGDVRMMKIAFAIAAAAAMLTTTFGRSATATTLLEEIVGAGGTKRTARGLRART